MCATDVHVYACSEWYEWHFSRKHSTIALLPVTRNRTASVSAATSLQWCCAFEEDANLCIHAKICPVYFACMPKFVLFTPFVSYPMQGLRTLEPSRQRRLGLLLHAVARQRHEGRRLMRMRGGGRPEREKVWIIRQCTNALTDKRNRTPVCSRRSVCLILWCANTLLHQHNLAWRISTHSHHAKTLTHQREGLYHRLRQLGLRYSTACSTKYPYLEQFRAASPDVGLWRAGRWQVRWLRLICTLWFISFLSIVLGWSSNP